jgi:DNA-directed RNA polymerase specialized sigma24 family protein
MTSDGSVTHWLHLLKAGDQAAAQPLWEGYFGRLVALARRRLLGTSRRAADEEDVALSAFDSFCRGVEQGRFPRLDDRGDLWQILVMLTVRKALQLARRECREKRGGGKVLNEADLADVDRSGEAAGLAGVLGSEPSPEFAAQVAEECRRLLDALPDAGLRSIAVWKMEGHTTEEIAARLGCVPRTVERRLRLIRDIWSREEPP